jgi:hypothetical protein
MMKTILSALIALSVLVGVASSTSAFDGDDGPDSSDEIFSTGQGD